MKKILGYCFIILFLLSFVDGALPQLQMAIFGGRIPFASIIIKLAINFVICAMIFLHVYQKGTLLWPGVTASFYLLLLVFLFCHFLLFIGEYPANYLLLSYNAYYLFLLLLPFSVYLEFSNRHFIRMMFVAAMPLLCIGFSQYFLNSPLLPTASADGYFNVSAWGYYDNVRAFSLFSSGLQYGYFISLLAPIFVFLVLNTKGIKRFFSFMGLSVLSFACYTTLTRNAYIQFVFSVTTAILLLVMSRKPFTRAFKKVLPLLPILYGLTAATVVFFSQLLLLVYVKNASIFQDESLLMRFVNWAKYYRLLTESGLLKLFFGVGLVSGSRVFLEEEVVIDNTFLAVALHIGVVGLILWLVLMWHLWRWILASAEQQTNNMALIAIASYWSTWISSGVFNTTFIPYQMLALLVFPILKAAHGIKFQTSYDKPAVRLGTTS